MPICFKNGDLFNEEADALVNTVNCVGVMGKGVALEFKKRWPDNFKHYRRICEKKGLRPGSLFVHEVADLIHRSCPRYIINFPTKDHWRAQSKLEYVEEGLDALVKEIVDRRILSIALPPLGCGNGGLIWGEVRPLIERKLGALSGVQITVLEPYGGDNKPEHQATGIAMTYPRAILLKSLAELEPLFDSLFDRISLQKIVYLLQKLGVPFGLSFKRNLFGPYSETLRKAFVALERHEMVEGFTSEERLAKVTAGGYALADDYLIRENKSDQANDVIRRLSHLIEGFEGPHGLELLSSVHHLVEINDNVSIETVITEMGNWNEVKRNKFSPSVIKGAYLRLREDGLIK